MVSSQGSGGTFRTIEQPHGLGPKTTPFTRPTRTIRISVATQPVARVRRIGISGGSPVGHLIFRRTADRAGPDEESIGEVVVSAQYALHPRRDLV